MTNEPEIKATKNRVKQFFRIFMIAVVLFFILSISSVFIYRFVPIYYTPLMFWKSATSLFQKEMYGIEKQWVPLEQINKTVQKSVIKAEDAKFYLHNGFDFEAIEKAMIYNKTHKKQKGASTISQQTAKNVFLWPARNWLRKGVEVYFTVLIEMLWPKKRILEVYLNVIELGPGVYGVEAAAQKYFHKKAKYLTTAQASLMAAVLPNPIKFNMSHPSSYIQKRQQKIMGRGVVSTVVETVADTFHSLSDEEAPKEQLKVEEAKEFFDIKFDTDEEEEKNEVVPDDTTPANE